MVSQAESAENNYYQPDNDYPENNCYPCDNDYPENNYYPSDNYYPESNYYPSNDCCPHHSSKPIASAMAIPSTIEAHGATMVTLDGSSSRMASGYEKLHYTWTQVRGLPALTINHNTYPKATVTIPPCLASQSACYVFRLVVTNRAGLSDSTEVSVSSGGATCCHPAYTSYVAAYPRPSTMCPLQPINPPCAKPTDITKAEAGRYDS